MNKSLRASSRVILMSEVQSPALCDFLLKRQEGGMDGGREGWRNRYVVCHFCGGKAAVDFSTSTSPRTTFRGRRMAGREREREGVREQSGAEAETRGETDGRGEIHNLSKDTDIESP